MLRAGRFPKKATPRFTGNLPTEEKFNPAYRCKSVYISLKFGEEVTMDQRVKCSLWVYVIKIEFIAFVKLYYSNKWGR